MLPSRFEIDHMPSKGCDVCEHKHVEDDDCDCLCHSKKPVMRTMRDFEMYQMFGDPDG